MLKEINNNEDEKMEDEEEKKRNHYDSGDNSSNIENERCESPCDLKNVRVNQNKK